MAALGQAAQPPWVSSNAAGREPMEEVPAESGLLVPVWVPPGPGLPARTSGLAIRARE